eukprot:3936495-Rhodomonas_salina.1
MSVPDIAQQARRLIAHQATRPFPLLLRACAQPGSSIPYLSTGHGLADAQTRCYRSISVQDMAEQIRRTVPIACAGCAPNALLPLL